jgi:hypothetical protein
LSARPFLSPSGLFFAESCNQFWNGCGAIFAIVASPRLEANGRRHPPNECCLARSAVREAWELRGRSVERLPWLRP